MNYTKKELKSINEIHAEQIKQFMDHIYKILVVKQPIGGKVKITKTKKAKIKKSV